ncbi:MAG: prolipoprotein diacylglyceryl transferase [Deltaproteobacteria bacterium]|nr:prolipoprotein diacylglyceryl transferase [Nannocystaceae bacterium]
MLEAFIPYITAPEKTLIDNLPVIGPLKLQFFGPLVAVGVILGWKQCLKYAKAKNIDEFFFRDYLFWMLVFAFVISHWVSVLFYFPDQVKENPWVLLTVWSGLSSVGGFFGAFVGMTYYLKKHKQPIIVYADATIYGLLVGWCFGRAGCSLVHDHPGQVVSEGAPPTEGLASWLAVGPWPPESNPTWRYDLGLIELMFAICLVSAIYFLGKPLTRKPGWLVGTVVIAYAPFRFFLDFLRADQPAAKVISSPDLRYSGLTPAQWFCIAFLLAGIYLVFFRKPKPEDLDYKKDSDRVAREAAAAKATGSVDPSAAKTAHDD